MDSGHLHPLRVKRSKRKNLQSEIHVYPKRVTRSNSKLMKLVEAGKHKIKENSNEEKSQDSVAKANNFHYCTSEKLHYPIETNKNMSQSLNKSLNELNVNKSYRGDVESITNNVVIKDVVMDGNIGESKALNADLNKNSEVLKADVLTSNENDGDNILLQKILFSSTHLQLASDKENREEHIQNREEGISEKEAINTRSESKAFTHEQQNGRKNSDVENAQKYIMETISKSPPKKNFKKINDDVFFYSDVEEVQVKLNKSQKLAFNTEVRKNYSDAEVTEKNSEKLFKMKIKQKDDDVTSSVTYDAAEYKSQSLGESFSSEEEITNCNAEYNSQFLEKSLSNKDENSNNQVERVFSDEKESEHKSRSVRKSTASNVEENNVFSGVNEIDHKSKSLQKFLSNKAQNSTSEDNSGVDKFVDTNKLKSKHVQKFLPGGSTSESQPETVSNSKDQAQSCNEVHILKSGTGEKIKGKAGHRKRAQSTVEVNKIKSAVDNVTKNPITSKKNKKIHITKLTLSTGIVCVEPMTPCSKTVVNGFRKTCNSPKHIDFKGQNNYQDMSPTISRKSRKRKCCVQEPIHSQPKPIWTKSGLFKEEQISIVKLKKNKTYSKENLVKSKIGLNGLNSDTCLDCITTKKLIRNTIIKLDHIRGILKRRIDQ